MKESHRMKKPGNTIKMSDQISITHDQKNYQFEIAEYLHHDGERCKFKVFQDGMFVASFTPDKHHILHVCQNQGGLPEVLLHLLADQIEALHPYGFHYT